MHLKIIGAEQLIYEGDIYGLKCRAIDGEVMCLDKHADYLSVIPKGDVTLYDYKDHNKQEKITLKKDFILLIEDNNAVLLN
ncbi:MAG: hypothetical protein PHV30_10155 [Candidatus Margulisbacteria bacterium]|nr:hypothetical protein [Candidatus Margulisiibacteriota bacterium]